MLGLLPVQGTFHEQLMDVLHSQLAERHMRQVRVARWRAQRMLQSSSYAVDRFTRHSSSAFDSPPRFEASPTADASAFDAAFDGPNNASYVFTSVDELRAVYGVKQRWWGDLDAVETRELYHSLLPTGLIEDEALPLAQRARLAVSARRAARLYARERALLPLCTGSQLFDGFRQLLDHGSFQPNGLSEEQIFSKYAEMQGLVPPSWTDDHAAIDDDDEAYTDFYLTVLRKSCSTNAKVDGMTAALGRGAVFSGGVGVVDTLRSGAESVAQLYQAAPPEL